MLIRKLSVRAEEEKHLLKDDAATNILFIHAVYVCCVGYNVMHVRTRVGTHNVCFSKCAVSAFPSSLLRVYAPVHAHPPTHTMSRCGMLTCTHPGTEWRRGSSQPQTRNSHSLIPLPTLRLQRSASILSWLRPCPTTLGSRCVCVCVCELREREEAGRECEVRIVHCGRRRRVSCARSLSRSRPSWNGVCVCVCVCVCRCCGGGGLVHVEIELVIARKTMGLPQSCLNLMSIQGQACLTLVYSVCRLRVQHNALAALQAEQERLIEQFAMQK